MASAPTALPRVTIQYCTRCKWNLRAFYFAQELISTFGSDIGEVAVQPSSEGTFIIDIYHASISAEDGEVQVEKNVLWDRRADGGFPETKELKQRVRDIIDPSRDLGHVDGKKKSTVAQTTSSSTSEAAPSGVQTPMIEQYADSINQAQNQEIETSLPKAIRPSALSRLTGETEAGRKFTPMDVDTAVVAGEQNMQYVDADGVKRNADGSICEDCN